MLRTTAVLCTFNGARFVEAQVESLFAQTRALDEIVAVDDASSDATCALLARLAVRSPVPMRVLRNDRNRGATANFERALSLAQGDVIFLGDQDDVWMPAKVATCLAAFADPAVMVVHTDARVVDADLAPIAESLFATIALSDEERQLEVNGRAFELLLRRNIVTGATMAVRRAVRDRALPLPPEWVHDEWLALTGALMGRLVRIEQPLIAYRQHESNLIGAERRNLADKLRSLAGEDGTYQRRQLARMERLLLRMRTWNPAPERAALQRVESTRSHAAIRASLDAARVKRVMPIARELLNGRYFDYSRGWVSVVRDLLGPIQSSG